MLCVPESALSPLDELTAFIFHNRISATVAGGVLVGLLDEEVVSRNFYRATTKAKAEKFWGIRPPRSAPNITSVAKPF